MPIYDWRHGYHDDPGFPVGEGPPFAHVRDAMTGEEIREVFWCNTDTNELERMAVDRNGQPAIDPETGQIKAIRERRQVTVEFTGNPAAP